MPKPPMRVNEEDLSRLTKDINEVESLGSGIRLLLGSYQDDHVHNINWEVNAAVEALNVFGSRWTIEILATLYIVGERRFNELRKLLNGISSRTLSDKLRACTGSGLIERIVIEGPPVRVTYRLTEHGHRAGRLLGPLVAYMKTHQGSIIGEE